MGKSDIELLKETMTEARQLLADLRGVQKDLKGEVREAKRLLATSFEERLNASVQEAVGKSDAALIKAISDAAKRVENFFAEVRDTLLADKTSIGQLAHDWALFRRRIHRQPEFISLIQEMSPQQLAAMAVNALQNAGIPVPGEWRNLRPEDVMVSSDPEIKDV